MFDFYDTEAIPCFGVAGNFTGHLEQAGEAVDFANVKTKTADAPKAVFPTYIPSLAGSQDSSCSNSHTSALDSPSSETSGSTPDFLKIFPFSSDKIIFPCGEEKLQIEPECAIIFEAEWKNGNLVFLKPLCFGASNDCSIRKAGARKISEKKNWGKCSKGFAKKLIFTEGFEPGSDFDRYRIASFLIRNGEIYSYGENSAIKDYSYFYKRLTDWLIEKFNFQKNEGPAEDIYSYLAGCNFPKKIMVSVGATRYTQWGEHNFLQSGDVSAVILYPEDKYSDSEIKALLLSNQLEKEGISALIQTVQI